MRTHTGIRTHLQLLGVRQEIRILVCIHESLTHDLETILRNVRPHEERPHDLQRCDARIEQQFGSRVLEIVEGCTDGLPDADGQKSDWGTRKRAYLAHLEAASADVLLVSGADKLHNARAIVSDLQRHGPSVFSRFTAGQEGTLWYYRSLAELFERRGAPVARALNSEVAKMLSLAT